MWSSGTLTLFALIATAVGIYFIMHFATGTVGLPMAYWFVPLFGAGGGAVGGVLRNDNKLHLCSIELPQKIVLGVIGDIFVGLGGACAIVFLFGSTLRLDPSDAKSNVLLISVSFIAGAFGKNIVELAGQRLLRLAEEKAKETVKEEVAPTAAVAFAMAATQMNNRGDRPAEALKMAEQAIKYDPASIQAHVEKGRALKLLGKIKEALAAVEEALRLASNDPRLLYNRACYMALLKVNRDEVLKDLKKACQAAPQLCELARKDPDLLWVRDLPTFKELMLATIEEALEKGADDPQLLYSKACYMSLLKKPNEEVLAELKKAFDEDPKLKESARDDPALEPLRSLPEFRTLVGISST